MTLVYLALEPARWICAALGMSDVLVEVGHRSLSYGNGLSNRLYGDLDDARQV